MRTSLLVLVLASSCTITLNAQNKPPLLSLVEKSISQREPEWRLTESKQEGTSFAFPTGTFEWTNGKDKIYVRVTARNVASAIEEFGQELRSEKSRSVEAIGDAAVVQKTDSFFITRFRKGGIIVSVLSNSSEALSTKMAGYIANVIPNAEEYSKLAPIPPSDGDFCHVYVVDVANAQKWNVGSQDPKTLKDVETNFPEFRTDIGEETLTNKTYTFPNNKLIITASVYYTDESMASKRGVDSMMIGIVVAPTAKEDAFSDDDNAFAEATFSQRDTLRVKKYLKVNGRRYLVGMQCKSNGHNSLP